MNDLDSEQEQGTTLADVLHAAERLVTTLAEAGIGLHSTTVYRDQLTVHLDDDTQADAALEVLGIVGEPDNARYGGGIARWYKAIYDSVELTLFRTNADQASA